MKANRYGFFLNGETLIKTVVCSDMKAAKAKLNFLYPVNFNIQIKKVGTETLKEI